MRIVIYGAGAVGGVIGGRLFQAGHDVTLIARGEHLRVLQERGLTLASPLGSDTLPVPAVGGPAEAGLAAGDAVVLAMKSQHTEAALADLVRAAPPGVAVVCAQNGVDNERRALRSFPDVYGVSVMLPATHLEPGVVLSHSAGLTGLLDLGRYPSGVDDTARALAEAFSEATFASEARADIMRWKYRKLLLNLGNAVEAVCGGEARRGPLYGLVMEEGAAALAAAGIDVVSGGRGPGAAGRPPPAAAHRGRPAGGRLVMAEPGPGPGLDRGRLPQRRDRPAGPPPRGAHPRQRAVPAAGRPVRRRGPPARLAHRGRDHGPPGRVTSARRRVR